MGTEHRALLKYSISSDSYSKRMGRNYYSHFSCKIIEAQRIKYLPKVTQLVSGQGWIRTPAPLSHDSSETEERRKWLFLFLRMKIGPGKQRDTEFINKHYTMQIVLS